MNILSSTPRRLVSIYYIIPMALLTVFTSLVLSSMGRVKVFLFISILMLVIMLISRRVFIFSFFILLPIPFWFNFDSIGVNLIDIGCIIIGIGLLIDLPHIEKLFNIKYIKYFIIYCPLRGAEAGWIQFLVVFYPSYGGLPLLIPHHPDFN